MATAAQMNANRENAKKRTGPRTSQGKAISSRNSLVPPISVAHAPLPRPGSAVEPAKPEKR